MAASSEIEKLERRYAENPDGRYFAPLADAYRKAGQVDRALEVVRAGIEKHPDYLSAHIVLGRCLLDKKEDDSAGQAFQKVLGLDSENIIALKSLAEIAERKGEPLQSRQWLQQLLKVDPMNADADADLQRLGGAIGEMTTAPMPAIEVEPAADISFADVRASNPEIQVPHPPEAPPGAEESPSRVRPSEGIVGSAFVPPTEEEPAPALDVKPFDDALAWGTGERSSRAVTARDVEAALHEHEASLAAPLDVLGAPADDPAHVVAEPLPTEESWQGGPPVDEWSGRASAQASAPELDAFTIDRGEAAPFDIPPEVAQEGAPEVPAADSAASLADLPIIMPEDVTPPDEMARPSSKQFAVVEPEPVEPEAVAEPAEAATAPLLTETMGDLYLKQGFRAEAADVYRRLLEQRPGDAALSAKLGALEAPPPALSAAALGTESTRTWLRTLAQARLEGPAPAAEAPPAGPSPLEQAFDQPEVPAAPEPVPAEPAGEPARPAQDAFTLDNLFGTAGGAPPASAAPATPPPPAATGTSFDQFFGAPPEQGSVRPETGPAAAAPPPDDVSSFNSWLRGLKR